MTTVAVIVPARASERRLGDLLYALSLQDRLADEVIIVRNPVVSEIDHAAQDVPVNLRRELRVLSSPISSIPAALNLGIRAAKSDVIVRLDAHICPYPDYLRRSLRVLHESEADVVGGRWEIRPGADSLTAQAIALAVGYPLCTGAVRYRRRGDAPSGHVDTVPHGCFRRSLWERVGDFDETLLSNEEYEFYWRVRASGGRVFFDPAIRSIYYARATYGAVMRQYFRYGWWKFRMLRKHPASIRWRQLLPILALGTLVVALGFAIFNDWGRIILAALLLMYGIVIAVASVGLAAQRRAIGLIVALPLAFSAVHFAWSVGAWVSLVGGSATRSWLEVINRAEYQ